jgi:hypothetical protein
VKQKGLEVGCNFFTQAWSLSLLAISKGLAHRYSPSQKVRYRLSSFFQMHARKRAYAPRIRWTEDMEGKLHSLVSLHGQNWPLIGKAMDMSAKKVREHWRMTSATARTPFSAEEDHLILELGPKYVGRWAQLAAKVSDQRSALQVRNRYGTLVMALNCGGKFLQPDASCEIQETEEWSDEEFHFEFSK